MFGNFEYESVEICAAKNVTNIKFVAIRCVLSRSKCPKRVFGGGPAPRTPLRELTRFPRLRSRLGRGIPLRPLRIPPSALDAFDVLISAPGFIASPSKEKFLATPITRIR